MGMVNCKLEIEDDGGWWVVENRGRRKTYSKSHFSKGGEKEILIEKKNPPKEILEKR